MRTLVRRTAAICAGAAIAASAVAAPVAAATPAAVATAARVAPATAAATPTTTARRNATPTTTARRNPTPTQIRRAVAQAMRSDGLWATVNVCTRQGHGGLVGIRGEMPALGFPTTLSMSIQLRQYSAPAHRFVWVRGSTARRPATIGPATAGLHQDGAEFSDTAANGDTLDAVVFFTWSRAGRTIAQAVRMTTSGHHSAAYGTPRGYSAASCQL